MPRTRVTFLRRTTDEITNTKQSIVNAVTLPFTQLLPSKRSSGPVQYRTGNPRGGFPRVWGLPDYDSFFQPVGVLSPGAPGMPISPKLAPTDSPGVTRRLPAFTDRLYPNCSLCAHSLTLAYTISVRAFTVLLL